MAGSGDWARQASAILFASVVAVTTRSEPTARFREQANMADLSYSLQFLNVTFGDDDLLNDSAIRDQPLFESVDIEMHGGFVVDEKFYLGPPRGFSGNLTDAQQVASTANGGAKRFRWQHPFGEHVGSVQVAVSDVIQGRPDQAAADRALESEFDKALASEGQLLNEKLLGAGGLSIASGVYTEATSGGFPTFTVRFTDPADARNIQIGDQVVISITDGSSAGTLVGQTGYVLSRDIQLGYARVAPLDDIDVAGNPGGWVDGVTYFLFRLGEYTDGDPDQIITSYERYLPSSAASDTLHNVDRSVDTALSGGRLTAALEVGSIVQRAKRLITIMQSRLGLKKMDNKDLLVVLNSEDWGTAAEELESRVVREVGSTTEEGWEAFEARTAIGAVKFVSDPAKNKGRAFILNTALLKLYTASGKLFETIPDGSGNIIHLMPGTNTYEIRTIAKIAVGFGAPYMSGSFSTSVA